MKHHRTNQQRIVNLFLIVLLALGFLPAQAATNLRYGIGVAEPDATAVLRMGFDWMAVYELPKQRYPVNVLYRVPLNHWSAKSLDFWDIYQFEYDLHYQLTGYEDRIEAYEIGNEVNLYLNGWDAPPNAHDYVKLLCSAARTIKSLDPTAIIVSAGLSPVGRLAGNWQGHTGHNQTAQDEREYLKEFLSEGGNECVDAIGYHPAGFSANFDAEPDVNGGTPESNCQNGFCFRGVEKIHELLVNQGYPNKPIWATEVGWIAQPEDATCLNDYSWAGRDWQRVSRQKQAENLVGAFEYAKKNWDWLEAIFVFNLNFSEANYYHGCEQMRYYSVLGKDAYQSLSELRPQMQGRINYLPLISNSATQSVTQSNNSAILDTLRANGNYNILIEMLTIANLSSMFDNNENVTLFAPTDAAFESLPQAALDQLKQNPQTQLRQILLFHILQGRFTADMLQNGMKIQTLQGNAVKFDIRNGNFKVQDSNITPVPIQPAIGAIHSIDKVMLPPAS